MRQLFKKSSSKNGSKKKRGATVKPRKVTKGMTLTELQIIARKKGIQFAGLKKDELYRELINYGIIHV
jgi:hypothetical protein